MNNGHFRTEAGSSVEVSGKHHGIYVIWFDWLEEGACIEAIPSIDDCGARLGWQCECHGYFDTPLTPDRTSP